VSGFNKQVWMTVAQGGRWTAEEVKKDSAPWAAMWTAPCTP